MDTPDLTPVPEDWSRALAVVAHPDDMEYGASSAVARWTSQGKDVRYVLATRGEAGIDDLPPETVAPARVAEQVASCAAVGVTEVEFLDYPDGLLVPDLDLRRSLAAMIRKHQPEVVVSINFRETWGFPGWNHADHRVLGSSLLDSVRDAANRWLFPEIGMEPWGGVRFVAFSGSPLAQHAVDISDHIDAGISALSEHRMYLERLEGDMANPDVFLRGIASQSGPRLGVEYAATFEVINV